MNSQYFNKEQVANGELIEFLNVLMKQCYGAGENYNDIHIYPADCEAFVIEWDNIPWDHSYGGQFKYVDEDQVVLKEYLMPDNTFGYFVNDEEYKQFLADQEDKKHTKKQRQVLNEDYDTYEQLSLDLFPDDDWDCK